MTEPRPLRLSRPMLIRLFATAALAMSTLAAHAQSMSGTDNATTAEIRHLIDVYVRSVDLADVDLAGAVWSTTPRVGFIHPRGHERGWDQVAESFYRKTMGATFTQRTLRLSGEPRIEVYGDCAVAEFDWNFVAVRRDNGEEIHTRGRESQLYVRDPRLGWRLVHVHYSGPPVTETGRGF